MPSYEKRESGLWSVRFTVYDGPNEKQKRLSGYETKRAAKEAYEKYMAENVVQKKRTVTPADDFEDLVLLFLEHEKTKLKESSYNDYVSRITNHILPYFRKKTTDIKPVDVLNWQHAIDHYSYKYKHTIRETLISIFRFGHKYYDLPNPAEKVEPFRNTAGKKEMLVWSEEEFKQFIAAVDDPIYHAFFRFLYTSGCRRGEALALTRDDVAEQSVRICKSLTFKTKEGTYKITPPKNESSVREITMPQSVIDEILALPENVFLFGRAGKPLSENTIARKLKRYAEISGVKPIRIHDLRHSHASLLLSKGISIVAVSKRLGHANTQMTLNTYAHLMPSDTTAVANALSGL